MNVGFWRWKLKNVFFFGKPIMVPSFHGMWKHRCCGRLYPSHCAPSRYYRASTYQSVASNTGSRDSLRENTGLRPSISHPSAAPDFVAHFFVPPGSAKWSDLSGISKFWSWRVPHRLKPWADLERSTTARLSATRDKASERRNLFGLNGPTFFFFRLFHDEPCAFARDRPW